MVGFSIAGQMAGTHGGEKWRPMSPSAYHQHNHPYSPESSHGAGLVPRLRILNRAPTGFGSEEGWDFGRSPRKGGDKGGDAGGSRQHSGTTMLQNLGFQVGVGLFDALFPRAMGSGVGYMLSALARWVPAM
eukprot:608126-Prorocentrum_minimum.AAC.1